MPDTLDLTRTRNALADWDGRYFPQWEAELEQIIEQATPKTADASTKALMDHLQAGNVYLRDHVGEAFYLDTQDRNSRAAIMDGMFRISKPGDTVGPNVPAIPAFLRKLVAK